MSTPDLDQIALDAARSIVLDANYMFEKALLNKLAGSADEQIIGWTARTQATVRAALDRAAVVVSHDASQTMRPRFVDCGHGLLVRPERVSWMRMNRRHCVNGSDSELTIVMTNGDHHTVRHEPDFTGGADAYAVERAILEGR